jgi:NAD(P)-dependent dehydrogenase (short-subunit alcohol dehydrogenase family)
MKQLKGRVAVVTGGASGIGYAMAERFAGEGMKIVLADIESAALEDAEGRLRSGGAEVIGVETDVSRAEQVQHLAERALDAFGAVNVVCNNAGVSARGSAWEQTLPDWEWVMGVNLWGVIHGVRTFMPILLEQDEAHIVNTASVAGLVTGVLNSYSVTKQAVVGLSESIYLSLQQRGATNVGVSVLCPGWVNTRIIDSERNRPAANGEPPPLTDMEAMMREAIRAVVATGKDPAEIAGMVVEAIRTGRFYILTHPEMNTGIATRFNDILEGKAPRANFG